MIVRTFLVVATLAALSLGQLAAARDTTPLTPEQQKAKCTREAEDYSSRKKKRRAYFEGCMKQAAAAAAAAAKAAEAAKPPPHAEDSPEIQEEAIVEAGSPSVAAKPGSAQPEKDAEPPTKLDLCAASAEAKHIVGVRRVNYINDCMKR
jgi:hypothetical protein